MNRSTYALKSHLTTFPSSAVGEQQSFYQITGGMRQRAYLPRRLLAALDFKGVKAAPVVFAQTYMHTSTHTRTHIVIEVKICKPQNV